MVRRALNSRFVCPTASITSPHGRPVPGEEMRRELKACAAGNTSSLKANGDFSTALLHCLSSPTVDKKIPKKKKKKRMKEKCPRPFLNFLILLRALVN